VHDHIIVSKNGHASMKGLKLIRMTKFHALATSRRAALAGLVHACCAAPQRIYEERNALIGYLCQNLNPSLENVRAPLSASQKNGIARDILCPSGVLLAAIKPHRLDGDGQCAR
jgi:hypothetical protein